MSAAAETWLEIGGLTFHLASDDARLVPTADKLARPFFVDRRRADVELQAHWTDTPIAPAGEVVFDCGHAWQLQRASGEFLFSFRSSSGDPSPYKLARFDPGFTTGDIDLYRPRFAERPTEPVDPLEYPLDELLTIHVLSQGKGVEIHACALLDAGGRAFVFAGQSGAGKSTLARLWAGVAGITMLSDERVVLRTDRHPVTVHGTPWHGDAMLVSPRSGALAGVFLLRHAPSHALVPTRGSLAAATLLACAFLPFHSEAAVQHTMIAVERVTSTVPCHDLRFAPDASVIDLLTRETGILRAASR
jgi:hypothetical protein